MKSLIALASTLAIAAAGTGQLPKIVQQVRIAQLQILKQMQTVHTGEILYTLYRRHPLHFLELKRIVHWFNSRTSFIEVS